MSFREKMAWAMMIILIVGGAWYFQMIRSASIAIGETAPPIPAFIVGYVALIIVAAIVLAIFIAVSSPKEANAPVDERERLVEDRAGHISGVIMGLGAFTAMVQFMWNGDGNFLFHSIFASLMVSQIAEYALQIYFYRRGV